MGYGDWFVPLIAGKDRSKRVRRVALDAKVLDRGLGGGPGLLLADIVDKIIRIELLSSYSFIEYFLELCVCVTLR